MSATIEEATRKQENKAGQAKDRAARPADTRVRVPGGHEAHTSECRARTLEKEHQ